MLLTAKETIIGATNTNEISGVRQEHRAQVAVEGLTVIIELVVHGARATTESTMIGAVGDEEESRLPDRNDQNVEHGGDLARQEGTN